LTAAERKKMRDAIAMKGDKKGELLRCSRRNEEETANVALSMLSRNEDEMLQFAAKVNRIYEDVLGCDAPFITFVLCGMQSTGKSTIMERFLNSVLNIVQAGTGTRCPLDTTCIHDSSKTEPSCELSGKGLAKELWGKDLTVQEVFKRINENTAKLVTADSFSTESVRLMFRANNVQNMRFVDTPGIIENISTGSKDNREKIKTIICREVGKPNTKLCVLLEPKEFDTNSIINFCDENFGGRKEWINNATFLMTRCDKHLGDVCTAFKSNQFFNEFFKNKCFPILLLLPSLQKIICHLTICINIE
jgi:hypothetical protein